MTDGKWGPETETGKIDYVKVATDYGWVQLKNGGLYILWDASDDPSSIDSVRHSMWVSLLEHAIANDLYVEIGHPSEESGRVVHVSLKAP